MATNQKYKLLIEAVVKNHCRWDRFNNPSIQNKIFSYGVKITNIDTSPFPGGNISNIIVKSGEHKDMTHASTLTFSIPLLNPGQTKEIIFENLKTALCGIIYLHLDIKDPVGVAVFQFDDANKEQVELPFGNHWMDSIFVVSAFEHQQMWTTRWLVGLTIITLVQGLWGLKDAAKFCWGLLVTLFFSAFHFIFEIIKFFGNIKSPHA